MIAKTYFLRTCFSWDSKLSSLEVDQKFKFDGTIGYGDSYLEFLFHHFVVFSLHAILHDAAGVGGHIVANVLATVTLLDEDQIHVCLVTLLKYYFALR